MWKKCSLLLLSTLSLSAFENEIRVENSNFTLSQASLPSLLIGGEEEQYLYNYNRLRINNTLTSDGFYATAIVDIVNYLGSAYISSPEFNYMEQIRPDIPFDTYTNIHDYGDGAVYGKIHRLYAGYADEKHHITAGIQKISMGVGHIWTPTDLYNPKNSFALEPDEVFGVLALSYSYAPSALSTMQAVVSVKEDESLKYALRYKAFWDFADVGVSYIKSDDIQMIGYEIEGDFFDTGIQWRSEGGYYKSVLLDTEFYQAILGFDYAFTWGLNWTLEGHYSSETYDHAEQLTYYKSDLVNNLVASNFYLGTSLSYEFDLALSGSLLAVGSFDQDTSAFVAPSLTYTVNDHHQLSLGAMLNVGSDMSEFGIFGNSYYVSWKWSW